jgi:hypothetical protein
LLPTNPQGEEPRHLAAGAASAASHAIAAAEAARLQLLAATDEAVGSVVDQLQGTTVSF